MAGGRTVAIIGAGMAGLAAARRLCNAGVTVQLFEANGKAGGCCATTRIGGYTFNDGAVYLAMPGMLERLFAMLELDRSGLLPLRRIAALQSATLPDGAVVDIASGPRIHISPAQRGDAQRVESEVDAFLNKWEPALRFFADDLLVRPLSLPHLLAHGWRHLARLRGTVASHLARSFSSPAVRAAFGGVLLYTGAPPDRMPAASLLGLVAMLRDGCFLPEGGMGRIPEVLCDAVSAQGGSIRLHAPARRILVRNGRVHALEVENEGVIEVVEADAVISTVSAMHTYGSLLPEHDVPARIARRLRRAPLSHKGFVVQLGLANRIAARSHTHCALPWLDQQAQIFDAIDGDLRWPIYTVPTVTLPELAPGGGSIVEMFVSIDQAIAPGDWSDVRKQEAADRAVQRLRREHELDIAVSRILSPREFRDDAHLYAGALYGLSPVAGPGVLFPHRTPISGLYHAGQTTWPGFGVVCAGLSGVFAADALLQDASR